MAHKITRRSILGGTAGLGVGALLSGCVGGSAEPAPEPAGTAGTAGSAGTAGTTAQTTTAAASKDVVLQSNMQDEGPRKALAAVVQAYPDYKTSINTVATSQFRAQLPTYLNSATPPDVLTWYAGSVTSNLAENNLLADVSDLWTGEGNCAKMSDALKDLSTTNGKQYFVPTNYYWWAIFYKKSAFAKWGITPPKTWDEFMAICEQLQGKGIAPLTCGWNKTAWMTAAWFDYLNLRVNGADYHRKLLTGESSFDSAEVRNVMKYYAQIQPYFHKNSASWDAQTAAASMAKDESAMYLVGTFATSYFPKDQQEDLDFFSVPVIDPKVIPAEEAPTDGFIVSAKSKNIQGAKDVANYLASAKAQQMFIEQAVSANLPTSPDVDVSTFSPLIRKGHDLLSNTKQITQFFNRDSSDDLQNTADAALVKFLMKPGDVDAILKEWQAAAAKVFAK